MRGPDQGPLTFHGRLADAPASDVNQACRDDRETVERDPPPATVDPFTETLPQWRKSFVSVARIAGELGLDECDHALS